MAAKKPAQPDAIETVTRIAHPRPDDRCVNCSFWIRPDAHVAPNMATVGTCHRSPSKFPLNEGATQMVRTVAGPEMRAVITWHWPPYKAGEWCGEHVRVPTSIIDRDPAMQ